jgi:hypothetical protein
MVLKDTNVRQFGLMVNTSTVLCTNKRKSAADCHKCIQKMLAVMRMDSDAGLEKQQNL